MHLPLLSVYVLNYGSGLEQGSTFTEGTKAGIPELESGPFCYSFVIVERAAFESWLRAYGRAWMERNPQAATDLFAEDGTYQVTPFVEPMRGRLAIFNYWTHVAETERDIQFGYEVLAVSQDASIARWWASFLIVPQGLQTKLDGIFLISLDADGRRRSLREWWHKEQN